MGIFYKESDIKQIRDMAEKMSPIELCRELKLAQSSVTKVAIYNCYSDILKQKAFEMDDEELLDLFEFIDRGQNNSARRIIVSVMQKRGL